MYNNNIDVDIDECELELYNCGAHAACRNTVGSYNCTCISGYEGDGINCSGKYVITTTLSVYFSGFCSRGGKCL